MKTKFEQITESESLQYDSEPNSFNLCHNGATVA